MVMTVLLGSVSFDVDEARQQMETGCMMVKTVYKMCINGIVYLMSSWLNGRSWRSMVLRL